MKTYKETMQPEIDDIKCNICGKSQGQRSVYQKVLTFLNMLSCVLPGGMAQTKTVNHTSVIFVSHAMIR